MEKSFECDDAISRKDIQDYIAKYLSQYLYEDVRQAVEVIDAYIGDMPSVTQKSESVTEFADRCRECGAKYGKYRKEAKRWKNKWLKSQKSGKWNTFERVQGGIRETWYECPKCKWSNALLIPRNYCPNCGARNEIDCRDCKEFDDCPCGKDGHESGTSQGYSIGECKDFEPQESEVRNDSRRN